MIFCTIEDLKIALATANPEHAYVDVRSPEEYEEGHIAGFINVPIDSPDEAFAPYLQHTVYVICETHGRSQRVAKRLDDLGAERAVVVHGGMFAWAIHDNEVVS